MCPKVTTCHMNSWLIHMQYQVLFGFFKHGQIKKKHLLQSFGGTLRVKLFKSVHAC